MNKICTTIEQSKKLIELGLDVNTADMIWIEDYLGYDSNGIRKHGEYRLYGDMLIPAYGQDSVPAWSLAALLELMPVLKSIDNTARLRTIKEDVDSKFQYCAYYEAQYYTSLHDNPLDAAFEMICWLKENGKL